MRRVAPLALSCALALGQSVPRAQGPSAAAHLVVDAAVVDDRGEPVADLAPADFVVEIDGRARAVAAASFVRRPAAAPAPGASARRAYSTNRGTAATGLLVLLAFDRAHLSPASTTASTAIAAALVERLPPSDRVGIASFPNGGTLAFTPDRGAVREALTSITSVEPPSGRRFPLTAIDALALQRDDARLRAEVLSEYCGGAAGPELEVCSQQLLDEAAALLASTRQRAADSVRALRTLLREYRRIEGPKVVIWFAEGLPVEERDVEIAGLGAQAEAADAAIYAIPVQGAPSTGGARRMLPPGTGGDRPRQTAGLDIITASTRGAVVAASEADRAPLDRLVRELTGHYRLSIEPLSSDRDGRAHRVTVRTRRPGVVARARREMLVPIDPGRGLRRGAIDTSEGTLEEQVQAVLTSPVLATELPLKVATLTLRDASDASSVRVVVSTEVGDDADGPLEAGVGYILRDARSGKTVASGLQKDTLTLLTSTPPAPLLHLGTIEIPPGAYSLRLAAIDASGRRGAVEHRFEARLATLGAVTVSDLLLAPATDDSNLAPPADPVVTGAPLAAQVELAGSDRRTLERARVTLEVAETDAAEAIASASVTLVGPVNEVRTALALLPAELLPPGDYVARAVVSVDGRTDVVRRVRPFRIARPVTSRSAFDPDARRLAGTFGVGQILDAALLGPRLDRAVQLEAGPLSASVESALGDARAGRFGGLAANRALGSDRSLTASFLRGLGLLNDGRYDDAAVAFRAAVRASPEFVAGVFYLGGCYAAAGNTREAVSAWQSVLETEGDSPAVYRVLADGLLRLDDAMAGEILEEGVTRWPDDEALVVRATVSQARNGDADAALARVLPLVERDAPNTEALPLATHLVIARLAGAESPAADDVALLRRLADRLRAASGRLPPLVERWLSTVSVGR